LKIWEEGDQTYKKGTGSSQPFFQTKSHLILASGSPRRKQFFVELGMDFEVLTADVEEKVRESETPENFVQRLALEKALAVVKLHAEPTRKRW